MSNDPDFDEGYRIKYKEFHAGVCNKCGNDMFYHDNSYGGTLGGFSLCKGCFAARFVECAECKKSVRSVIVTPLGPICRNCYCEHLCMNCGAYVDISDELLDGECKKCHSELEAQLDAR